MKKYLSSILILLGMLVPQLAMAEVLNPRDGTAWDVYVYGNAYVIKEIFTGISLLMTGEGSGFKTLLLFMASLGFLTMAIGAGFDPGKNLLRMFTYIIVAWFVSYSTTTLTANVTISDMVDTTSVHMLSDVPAIVALPAALTSQVGLTFTNYMETYFSTSIPKSFTISGGGQFNLFSRMAQETSQYVFTTPMIKKTVSAYTANCVVPAIALGTFKGKAADGSTLTGVDALTKSVDYLDALSSAAYMSILTPYYPANSRDVSTLSEVKDSPDATQLTKTARNNGLLVTCQMAFAYMSQDMANEARAMLDAGSSAWAKAGVQVPLESAFKDMLAQASVGATPASRGAFNTPSGFIVQQAAINSMSSNMREAAAQTGNNDLMQAAAISQAEQNQKSSWVAGFQMFNNMTGYVFTVLQAFIYALTPLIVIAMLIPGLGKTLVTNYLQILLWLTLWNPMLAIVNFIITLFASQGFASSVTDGGLSYENKGIISERANDLVIAAQFLGTMVPMLAWGIVKGAMAFTEFISAGVGSSMAASAGASAASGNISMGGLNMDTVSMNKYSTQASSAVGYQTVAMGANAGSLMATHPGGGSTATMNEQAVNYTKQLSQQASEQISRAKEVSQAISNTNTEGMTFSSAIRDAAEASHGSSKRTALTMGVAKGIQATVDGMSTGKSIQAAEAAMDALQATQQQSAQDNRGLSGSVGVNVAGTGGQGSRSLQRGESASVAENLTRSKAFTENLSAELQKRGFDKTESETLSKAITNEASASHNVSKSGSSEQGVNMSQMLSEVKSESERFASQMSHAMTLAENASISGNSDMATVREIESRMAAAQSSMPSASFMNEGMGAMSASVGTQSEALGAKIRAQRDSIGGQTAAIRGGVNNHAPGTGPAIDLSAREAEVRSAAQAAQNQGDSFKNQTGQHRTAIGKEAQRRVGPVEMQQRSKK